MTWPDLRDPVEGLRGKDPAQGSFDQDTLQLARSRAVQFYPIFMLPPYLGVKQEPWRQRHHDLGPRASPATLEVVSTIALVIQPQDRMVG
ncbi:MAG: hypothetical protein MUF54_20905 [Polyangiaceae bacterium]|nr:hypothetical protein [Polyangiaceae bacterium]